MVAGRPQVNYRWRAAWRKPNHNAAFPRAVSRKAGAFRRRRLTVEKTTVSGWKRSGERSDFSLAAAASSITHACAEAVERAAVAAGWTFHLEGGRMP